MSLWGRWPGSQLDLRASILPMISLQIEQGLGGGSSFWWHFPQMYPSCPQRKQLLGIYCAPWGALSGEVSQWTLVHLVIGPFLFLLVPAIKNWIIAWTKFCVLFRSVVNFWIFFLSILPKMSGDDWIKSLSFRRASFSHEPDAMLLYILVASCNQRRPPCPPEVYGMTGNR